MRLKKILLLGGLLSLTLTSWSQDKKWVEVAYDDCGEKGKQPHLVLGENYEMPAELSGSTAQRSCNFGGKVIYAFDKMDIHADYRMEVTFLADSERIIEIVADGNPVCESIHLPAGEVVKKTIDLPRHSFAYGQFVMVVNPVKGPNAIISEIRILSSDLGQLAAVSEESREALKSVQAYVVDTQVDAEQVLPTRCCR